MLNKNANNTLNFSLIFINLGFLQTELGIWSNKQVKKKQEKNQINKTLKSKFVYEDCFVYDESRFTGIKV